VGIRQKWFHFIQYPELAEIRENFRLKLEKWAISKNASL